MNQHDYLKKPFFAKFLEAQQAAKVASNQQQEGGIIVTKPILDFEHTLKYPSDSDEI